MPEHIIQDFVSKRISEKMKSMSAIQKRKRQFISNTITNLKCEHINAFTDLRLFEVIDPSIAVGPHRRGNE